MAYKVKFKHPHFPEDHVFGIDGLGQLKNDGSVLEVNEETERSFREKNGVGIEEAFANDPNVTVEGSSELSKSGGIPGVTAPPEEKEEGGEK